MNITRHLHAPPALMNSRESCAGSFRLRSEFGRQSWGCVSAVDSNRGTIFVADAHRDDGKRFVVRADEKLTAFVELESAIQGSTFTI
jgi:hypothetical protein